MALVEEQADIEEESAELAVAPNRIWRDIYYTVHDGLRLYARDYGDRTSALMPVICLPGLTRNSKDFHELAVQLSQSRRVIVPDYRGRGLSDHAADWRTYNPLVEVSDTLALLTLAGIEETNVIGTSRGGILAMLMAAIRPTVLKSVVLNDIGPEIAPEGLMRIRGYLEHAPSPSDWRDAVELLKKTNRGFENLSEREWLAYARCVFRDHRGRPRGDYDPLIRKTFISYSDILYDRIPTLWPQFAAMSHLPCLTIRGENSDLLTPQIVEKMLLIHPSMRHLTVEDRGHAPFLTETGIFEAITDILQQADAS
jgi:pimeloyl-ACP methyl ester carboxylesterase